MHDHLRDLGRNLAEGIPQRFWRQNTDNIDDLLDRSQSALKQFRGINMNHGAFISDHPFENDYCEISGGYGTRERRRSEMPGYKIWIRERFRNHKCKQARNNRSRGSRNLKFVVAKDGYLEDILMKVGSPDLLWLRWYQCPYSYLPSWIPMENLRVLEVAGSKLTELWRPECQAPLELRELNIFAGLSVFPKSIGQLKYLEKIVIRYWDRQTSPKHLFRTLPEEICLLHSLKYLELVACSRMMSLPDSFGELANLQSFHLEGAYRLQMLPNSFANLPLLRHLSLRGCPEIQELSVLEHLNSLETLNVSRCEKLHSIPGLRQLTKLRKLTVCSCFEIQTLPDLEHLTSLETLDVAGCEKLQNIPVLGYLTKLRKLIVDDCPEIQKLPGLEHLNSLETLNVRRCHNLQKIPGLGQLRKLQALQVSGCSEIQTLPGLEHLTSLETLHVQGCKSMPWLGQLSKLQELDATGCEIGTLPGLEHLTSLMTLTIGGCEKLPSIPGLGQLRCLDVSGCREIRTLSGLEESTPGLVQLRELKVYSCPEIQTLSRFEHLTSLETLEVQNCNKLQSISGLGQLTKLRLLTLCHCRALQELPGVESVRSPLALMVFDCPQLPWGRPDFEQLRQRLKGSLLVIDEKRQRVH